MLRSQDHFFTFSPISTRRMASAPVLQIKQIHDRKSAYAQRPMLALASICDEIADNIEDHLTGGKGHAPRGPLWRLS
jgi:hypothetical protein